MSTTAVPAAFLACPTPVVEPGFSPIETAVLESINCKVGAAESLGALMNFVFESTRAICPCDRLGLAFLDDDGRHLVSKWVRARYEPLLLAAGYAADIGDGSLREVIECGTPRIIDDLESYLRLHPHSESTRLLLREGVRSSMTCPLTVGRRNIGVMFRSSRRKHAYDEHQMQLHQAIAERLGQAVEKAYCIDQLSAAKQSYSEVLGFVSHELKNPLTVMINEAWNLSAGLLGNLSPQQRDCIERIRTKADYVTTLIRQYLDMAHLDDDSLLLQVTAGVDFAARVVEPVVEMLRPQLDEKQMRLRLMPDAAGRPVTCDPDLMQIVMSNLLSNAIKYGLPQSEIRICWQPAGDALRVAVRNEGPGFTPDERSRLFRRFSRIQSPQLSAQPGTGLGLYNAWRIIRLHQGKIAADSEPGKWAEFSFQFPLSWPAASGGPPAEAADATLLGAQPVGEDQCAEPHETRRPRVLAIDDDPDISGAVAMRLQPYGIDVLRAFNGMQGYWTSMDSRPDVILIDLIMPDGQGNYIVSRLKDHPLTKKTPIIVLTGQANPGLKRQMLGLGVDAYLTKPINWDELLRELRRHIDFIEQV